MSHLQPLEDAQDLMEEVGGRPTAGESQAPALLHHHPLVLQAGGASLPHHPCTHCPSLEPRHTTVLASPAFPAGLSTDICSKHILPASGTVLIGRLQLSVQHTTAWHSTASAHICPGQSL